MLKKIFVLSFVLVSGLSLFGIAKASSLNCYPIDGDYIFGYNGFTSKYQFIGAITNPFDSNSIANQFGAGNKFSTNSIMDTFGNFGSQFSTYSAFNKFALTPPVVVNRNYKIVGYLTVNNFHRYPISPYYALACAEQSFTSSN